MIVVEEEEKEERQQECRRGLGAIQRRDMARPNKYRPQVNFPFTRHKQSMTRLTTANFKRKIQSFFGGYHSGNFDFRRS